MFSKFGAPDGLCTRANIVVKGLIEKGHEVHVFTQAKEVEGVPNEYVHRFRAVPMNPHFSLDSLSAPRMIAEVCKEHDIEVLHAQMNSSTTETFLPFYRKFLPPLVATFHLAYSSGQSFYTTWFTLRWLASLFSLKNYDEIILVDPMQRPHILNYGIPENRLTVIRNGVNTEMFSPAKNNRNDGILDFVYVGRLSLDKGISTLLDAFARYHDENPASRLTLIGDGKLKTKMNNCVPDGSISWLGALEHESIPTYLKMMDVFVIPQNIGGLGMSVLEAMSCGLPVITTGIGETTRLLGSNEGILVRPHRVPEVVNAMRQMGQDEYGRLEMGRRCRQKVLRKYTWNKQIDEIIKVYERAITHHN